MRSLLFVRALVLDKEEKRKEKKEKAAWSFLFFIMVMMNSIEKEAVATNIWIKL